MHDFKLFKTSKTRLHPKTPEVIFAVYQKSEGAPVFYKEPYESQDNKIEPLITIIPLPYIPLFPSGMSQIYSWIFIS